MAWLPIAHVAINYRDYKDYWIKAYKVGTTTPKPMALKADGTNQVEKLQIDVNGFVVSSGGALVIPYVSGLFDMYMFPTEAEADANNTIDAIRIADGSQGDSGANVTENIPLVGGQTTVNLLEVNADVAAFYVQGQNVDRGLLLEGANNDYTVTDGSTIELNRSYPDGSSISAYGFIETDSGDVVSVHGRTGVVSSVAGDYSANQITNTPAGSIAATDVQAAINELDGEISLSGLWSTPQTNDFSAVAKGAYQIDASANTVDVTLPTLAAGDPFVFHNLITSTFKVQILNPIETIKGTTGDVAAGTNLELAPGQSVQLVAKSTTILSIVGAQL